MKLNDYTHFIAEIEQERKRQGISAEDMGQRAGLSKATYGYMLREGAKVSLENAIRYADVLGMDVRLEPRASSARIAARRLGA